MSMGGIFAAGLAVGWISDVYFVPRSPTGGFEPLRSPESGQYRFINPLIGFDIAASRDFPELAAARKSVDDFIRAETGARRLKSAGVYVRTLKNGHWFGWGDETAFSPGSLLKVPIMIAFLKKAESQPDILRKQITYQAASGGVPAHAAASHLVAGRQYAVDDLINAMIVRSDNGAKDTLLDAIDPEYLKEAFLRWALHPWMTRRR